MFIEKPPPPNSRACAYTCGSHCYTNSEVSAAQHGGYNLYSSNDYVNDYSHEYHNYEGSDFPVPGEYYEFPIMSNGDTYDGGSPGADRVIFNTDDQLAGVITHTGASGNDFVACTE
ncbi:guanyl-specific ribonuclease [Aspergillus sclerotialis]|uniref:ribonuclease T1 n=1 Tax=Aspergillus sclerotialis TaxID=2070753 RepID=A0A3A3A9R2_9EURO|nr:guanyl-specific ribonuclease [Aspergillus sclerotialis]